MEDGLMGGGCCIVRLEKELRWIHNKIQVLPWRMFIERLWAQTRQRPIIGGYKIRKIEPSPFGPPLPLTLLTIRQ
jgi:hypothetical protein